MGVGQREQRIYMNIASGKILHDIGEETDKTTTRVINIDDRTIIKYEIQYDYMKGLITHISIKSGEYGKQLQVRLEDGPDIFYLGMKWKSRYAQSFMQRILNVDFTKPVTVEPYQFKKKKETRTGVTLKQNDEKLVNYYVKYKGDNEKSEFLFGYPEFNIAYLDDEDDMDSYNTEVRKFLEIELSDKVSPFY